MEVVITDRVKVALLEIMYSLRESAPESIYGQPNVYGEPYLDTYQKAEQFMNKMKNHILLNVGKSEKERLADPESGYGHNKFYITFKSTPGASTWYIFYTKHPRLRCYKVKMILNSKRMRRLP